MQLECNIAAGSCSLQHAVSVGGSHARNIHNTQDRFAWSFQEHLQREVPDSE